jgi:hypothetical protein
MIAAGLQVGPSDDAEEKKKKADARKRGKKTDQKVTFHSYDLLAFSHC